MPLVLYVGLLMPGFLIQTDDSCGTSDAGDGPSNAREYARAHRYVIETFEPFGSRSDGILLFGYKCSRPSVEFDEVVIHSAQDEIHRPGKHHWKIVEFTFYEVLHGSQSMFNLAAEKVYKWWGSAMLNLETSLFNPPSDYLKDAQLNMLDGDGNTVWGYKLYDCWPSMVSPSPLTYSESLLSEISVSLRYSKARETKYGGSQ